MYELRALLLALPLTLVACDSDHSDHLVEAGEHVRGALSELRKFSLEMKDELFESIEEQREETSRAIEEVRERLESDEQLREKLEAKRAEVRRLIEKLRDEKDDAWAATRDSLVDACEELQEFVRELK